MNIVPKSGIIKKIHINPEIKQIDLDGGQLINRNNNSGLYRIDLSNLFFHNDHFFNQCLYDKNRPIDYDRVEKIIQSFNKQNDIFYTGFCTIGYINTENPQILDGQHRLAAANQLSKCYGYLRLVFFKDIEEMWDHYIMINQNQSLPNFYKSPENVLKNCIDNVCKNIHTQYKQLFSESRQCRKPNLNIDNLKETLFNIYNDSDNELLKNKIDLSKPEQIKNDLCDFNEDLKNKPPEYFYPFLKNPKTANDIYKKCQSKGNCYLGVLFTGTNDSAFQTKYITFISNKYARK